MDLEQGVPVPPEMQPVTPVSQKHSDRVVRFVKHHWRQLSYALVIGSTAVVSLFIFVSAFLTLQPRNQVDRESSNSKLSVFLQRGTASWLGASKTANSVPPVAPVQTLSPEPSVVPVSMPSPTKSPRPSSTIAPTPLASASPTPVPTPQPTQKPVTTAVPYAWPLTLRVLGVGFNPVQDGVTLADTYFSSQMGMSADQAEDAVFSATREAFARFSHGEIQFSVIKKIHVTDFPTYPDGFSYTMDSYKKCVYYRSDYDASSCEARKWQFNYVSWMSLQHICSIAQDIGADEIWMLSPPYIMAWENFMVGQNYGFDVNGASYTVPGCNKHFIIVNGTYDRPTNVLHNIAHRIESTMRYLTQQWRDDDRQNYWNRFAFLDLYSGVRPTKPICGNGHYPSNTTTAYDYVSRAVSTNICNDWQNFPSFTGATQQVNCETWGCTDAGWQEYWFSFIPHNSGQVTLMNKNGKPFIFYRNWWQYLLIPDNAILAHGEM